MSERITNEEFCAVLEEAFTRGQQLRFTPSGSSMLPMLDGQNDTVTFAPKPDRLKKYDVAFYRRSNGQPVLHRMIGFTRDGGYIFSGDNQYTYEYGIADENILALMVRFTHAGKEHSVGDLSYRLYIRKMMLKKRLRILALRVYHKLFRRNQKNG